MNYSHEIIMPNDDIPFKMFVFEGRRGNFSIEKHWHRSIEIFALFEGEIEFYVNEIKYSLNPGEFMLVNSNEIHSIHSPKENFTVVLQIPLTTFERYYTDEKFIYFTHSRRIHDEEFMQVIRDMYDAYEKKEVGYDLKVQSYFYELIYLLVSKYREVSVDSEMIRSSKKLNKLSAITAYMKETTRRIYRLKAWHRLLDIPQPICRGCFKNMRRRIIRIISMTYVWSMHIRIWSTAICLSE